MMILVRLIDVLVLAVQILGGRRRVHPVLRLGLWLAVLSSVAAGTAVLGLLLVLLERQLSGTA
ncbi:hypothetical protein [Nocardia brasiliensis]|uniref:Uncharacterized protein n=1 Tax=Nocardia brasiliensis (strain ATCC 700358 / HUJEG-1) TaxID=1133849 RepID=K0F010_NOCB7|nr:hypothetical protein [Nocardia brasiliensis]AFU05558.1 hypothetical protein O3I_038055 [Nocardia brasiliensis ATCC 700358]OCF86178.1 hypothetical protein AW168_32505 [Nocardia brasiliensis]